MDNQQVIYMCPCCDSAEPLHQAGNELTCNACGLETTIADIEVEQPPPEPGKSRCGDCGGEFVTVINCEDDKLRCVKCAARYASYILKDIEYTPSWYCHVCGVRIYAVQKPVGCPDCGGKMGFTSAKAKPMITDREHDGVIPEGI